MKRLWATFGSVAFLMAACGGSRAANPTTGAPPAPVPDDGTPVVTATPLSGVTLGAKLLVISADGAEVDLPAIRQTLDYLGTPYAVWIATERPGMLTSAQLAAGKAGNYQGIILATAGLGIEQGGAWRSALSTAERTALYNYEVAFGVRQLNWYSYPSTDLGFQGNVAVIDSTESPVMASLTSEGRAVFAQVNASIPMQISGVWAYAAKPAAPSIPLLIDGEGNALAVREQFKDGRDWLSVTFDSTPSATHTLALSYGLINWVTKGVFIGERHAFAAPQIDDLFLSTRTRSGASYRLGGADLSAAASWQQQLSQQPSTSQFKLSWCFNGSQAYALGPGDTLAAAARQLKSSFFWVNHSYTNPDFTTLSYANATREIMQNDQFGVGFGFSPFAASALVTPGTTGLANRQAMKAIHDAGVSFVASDASKAGQGNPSPNAGVANALESDVTEVPRRSANLFADVTTPDEWVSEYNAHFAGAWGGQLSYIEILEIESNNLVDEMLRGDLDPWQFHQGNAALYDGHHSLITALLAMAIEKYEAVSTAPIISLPMDQLGQAMAQRMQFDASGVAGVITPGESLALTTLHSAIIPVTGGHAAGAESYAGQSISHVSVQTGEVMTVPLR